jgi:hypothetical protein
MGIYIPARPPGIIGHLTQAESVFCNKRAEAEGKVCITETLALKIGS